ncbi:MAG: PAS domain S-box protein [Deltaproteobacteria bacterium]|nr:PAS domain S-box protein [Deltaproteobacteria bacterium]MDQ3297062.1 PAS domain S-box protein [Myxococcota bacterium]
MSDDFERFFDAALDLHGIANASGSFVRVNPAWQRTLGWSAEEVTSVPWLDLVHPVDRQATMDVVGRLFGGSSVLAFVNRYRCKDGSYRWIQWHAEVVGDEAYCTGRDVTVERAQKTARHERYVEDIAEALPQIVWTADPDGALDYYNQNWFDYTGMTLEQSRGWGWEPVLHPDDLQNCVERWTESVRTGAPYEVEYRFKRAADGTYRWHLGRALPIRDARGEIVKWFGTCTDIDDQRGAQAVLLEAREQLEARVRERTAELAASNERFRATTETAHDAIITAHSSGEIVGWNRGAAAIFGYSKDEAIGLKLVDLMPERFRVAHLAGFARIHTSGPLFGGKPAQLRALRRDGSEFPCELTLSSWKNAGQLFVTGILRDITDRERANEQLHRLAAIVEGSDDAIYAHDLEGKIVSWNAGAERLYGYSAAEILGEPFHVLVPADKRHEAAAIFARTHAGERFAHYETTRCRKDGSQIDVFLSASSVRDLQGKPSGISLIVRDITERKAIERKLLLADRMASVGTLAAGIAHEINSPLAFVMANLEILAEDLRDLDAGPLSTKLRELATLVNESRDGAERVRKIVRGLKTFSRSDEERRAPIELSQVLDLAANMTFNEIRHRARLIKDFGRVPLVEADESRLAQVFINLLVNAAHSIPEGDTTRNEIRISTFVDPGGWVVAQVQDTGAGIPQALLAQIFNPFFTTKDIGVGSGLGLSICEGIVTALGGTIAVHSELGKGSTFRVSLPAWSGESTVAHAASNPPQPIASGRRGRVLVIEDDRALATSYQRFLGSEHDVVVAFNGREGLDCIAAQAPFDAIVCDLMMPVLTGMDVHAELLRSDPELAARMVFVTGGAFTPRSREFLDHTANQWLEKPFSRQALRAAVRNIVNTVAAGA